MSGARVLPRWLSPSELWFAYRLRWKRRRLLWRALRAGRKLTSVKDRTAQIKTGDVLGVICLRNEALRLPHWLDHMRRLGVDHILAIDNGSTDSTQELLVAAPDVSVWQTDDGYRAARFGMDWVNGLLMRYGHGHWCLVADADELLIYPDWETKTLSGLARDLSARGQVALPSLMLDLYPKGPVGQTSLAAGGNPLERLGWFDAGPYGVRPQTATGSLWIQGGPRARVFHQGSPRRAPTLNKIPFLLWNRRYAFLNATHTLLPRHLNRIWVRNDAMTGVLLHTKLLSDAVTRAAEERERGQHFNHPEMFSDYYVQMMQSPDFWFEDSVSYGGAAQLEALGLMSRGSPQ